jgi:hypothetical protein
MSCRRFTLSSVHLLLGVLVATLTASPARAQSKEASAAKLACIQASDKAQQLRVAGKLIAARDTLHACAADTCPNVVREACSQWLGEVAASLPSIVIGAKDSDGKDLLDLKVSIDGALVTEHLGGLPVPIDPGRHKMRYEKADGVVVEEEILVGEGTKNRPVSVVFPGLAKPAAGVVAATPEALPPKGASTTNTVVGSVIAVLGAGGLGTALYLDLSTTSNVHSQQNTCGQTKEKCPSSDVSADNLGYDGAVIAVSAGIVALGVATYIFIAHPFGARPDTASHAGQAHGPSFRVIPSPHGGGLALTF